MSSPFVAEIRMFAGNFAITGWAKCNGQLLPISQNTALFSLVGTFYGGNGQSTFALPDLQDSGPIFWGQGPGLSDRVLGEIGGVDFVTLQTTEIPLHTHQAKCTSNTGTTGAPDPTLTWGAGDDKEYASTINTTVTMSPFALPVAGSSFPHNNLPPYLVVTFLIALQGIFPARG